MHTGRAFAVVGVVTLTGALSSSAPATDERASSRTATVVAVVAADTLEVRLDDGKRERLRLAGVVVARRGSCGAAAAAAESRRRAAGRRVTLVSEPRRPGRSYVDLAGGRDLGLLLVAAGHAQLQHEQPFARFLSYVPAQRRAEDASRGAWRACAADLAVTLEASPNPVAAGEPLVYVARVRNAGPLAAPDAMLELRPPDGAEILAAESSAGSCARESWLVTCSLGMLRRGAVVTTTVTVRAGRLGVAPARAVAWFGTCSRAPCGARPLRDANLLDDATAVLTTTVDGSPAPGEPPPPAAPAGPCHPSYPTLCVPPPPPDLNCHDIPAKRFPVLYTVPDPDPHDLDGDDDGFGCFKGDY